MIQVINDPNSTIRISTAHRAVMDIAEREGWSEFKLMGHGDRGWSSVGYVAEIAAQWAEHGAVNLEVRTGYLALITTQGTFRYVAR